MKFSNDQDYEILINKLRSNEISIDDKLSLINESTVDNQIKFILSNYYCKFSFLDGDLLKYIESYRVRGIPREGKFGGDLAEVNILMSALKSEQYKRFMRHILCQYTKSTHPVDDDESHECCVCWRPIYGSKNLKSSLDSRMMYSAFTGDKTKTCICINCLMNLNLLEYILEDLEDFDTLRMIEWIGKE